MTDTNRDAHAVSGVSEVERARMALRAIRLEVVPAIADDLTMIVEAAFAALAQPTDEAVIKRIKREAARLHLGGNSSPTDQQRLAATRFVEGAKFALAQSSGRGADHALAEQIAQAIESMEPFAHGRNETSKSFLIGWGTAKRRAARIARTFADEVTGR